MLLSGLTFCSSFCYWYAFGFVSRNLRTSPSHPTPSATASQPLSLPVCFSVRFQQCSHIPVTTAAPRRRPRPYQYVFGFISQVLIIGTAPHLPLRLTSVCSASKLHESEPESIRVTGRPPLGSELLAEIRRATMPAVGSKRNSSVHAPLTQTRTASNRDLKRTLPRPRFQQRSDTLGVIIGSHCAELWHTPHRGRDHPSVRAASARAMSHPYGPHFGRGASCCSAGQ